MGGRGAGDVHARALAYGALSFAAAAMQSVFVTYYVHVFLEAFLLDDRWFYGSQVAYMAWNSANDPVLGLVLARGTAGMGAGARLRATLPLLRWGGAAWALAFALVFLPLSAAPWAVGLHFLLALCLYDGMLSLVMLAHAALLADLAQGAERATFAMHSSACALLGSCSVLAAQLFWDVRGLGPFQAFCCGLALLCFLAFQASTRVLEAHAPAHAPQESRRAAQAAQAALGSVRGLRKATGELLSLRSFWTFVAVNLVQVFNCHFNSNFMGITMTALLRLDGGLGARGLASALLTASALLPHLLVVLLTPLARARGLHAVLQGLFCFKLCAGLLLALLCSADSWTPVLVFLVANKSFSEAICRHGNLVLADICDEDRLANHRDASAAPLVFGANAFFTKAGQSLAPALGWALLGLYGYREGVDSDEMRAGLFSMLWLVPVACAAVQLLLWSRFDLRGARLLDIQARLAARDVPV